MIRAEFEGGGSSKDVDDASTPRRSRERTMDDGARTGADVHASSSARVTRSKTKLKKIFLRRNHLVVNDSLTKRCIHNTRKQ